MSPPQETRRGATLAEGVGSFLLVLVGVGSLWIGQGTQLPIGRFGVALVCGIALSATVYALKRISGGYLNPAVTVAAFVAGRLSPRTAASYFIAQMGGAAAAGLAFRLVFPESLQVIRLGAPIVADGVSIGLATAIEAIVAFAWMLTFAIEIWNQKHPEIGPLVIGLVYGGMVLAFGGMTGAAGNPARAFGPAFASGNYTNHVVYWLGPVMGAVLAAVAYLLVTGRTERQEETASREGPDRALVHYQEGIILYREGHLEEAARRFALATESDPGWPLPYCYVGIVYRDFGDEVRANAFLSAALHYRTQDREGSATRRPWG